MTQLMYRRSDGSVGVLKPMQRGSILIAGTPLPEWKRLDASMIPFSGVDGSALPSVSTALDHILKLLYAMEERLATSEFQIGGVASESAATVAFVRDDVAKAVEYMTTESRRFSVASHQPTSVTALTNPALALDAKTQQLTLDFSVKRSYDDSRSLIGANSIQGAIEKVASLVAHVQAEVVAQSERIQANTDAITRLERIVQGLTE